MKDIRQNQTLLEVSDMTKSFVKPVGLAGHLANLFGAGLRRRELRALVGVSLELNKGDVLGIVGESGCGKSTLARILAGVSTQTSGTITYGGRDVETMTRAERRDFNRSVQMVFQDPFASLNPRLRVLDIVGEAPVVHGIVSRRAKRDYVAELLKKVGLPSDSMYRFPQQFSGGQRQRIGIARALALRPTIMICDESVAALDVSIQAQVLNLFLDLQQEQDLTYIFISHDLGVMEYISNRIVIMYLGRVVESGPTEAVFANPRHPYTRMLLDQRPSLNVERRLFKPVGGELPSPLNPPSGCPFHPRCPLAIERCSIELPKLRETAPARTAACHLDTAA